jgi:hypothetical protein
VICSRNVGTWEEVAAAGIKNRTFQAEHVDASGVDRRRGWLCMIGAGGAQLQAIRLPRISTVKLPSERVPGRRAMGGRGAAREVGNGRHMKGRGGGDWAA